MEHVLVCFRLEKEGEAFLKVGHGERESESKTKQKYISWIGRKENIIASADCVDHILFLLNVFAK